MAAPIERIFASLLVLMAGVLAATAEEAGQSRPTKDPSPTRADRYGNPLPAGAIARIGTVRLRHGENIALHVAFSPDGKSLASASRDGTFRRWDVTTGKEVWRFEETGANAIAYSPDGRTLAGSSSSRLIHLWDAASGREKLRIRCLSYMESVLAFSPDGKILAAPYRFDIRLFDTATGQNIGKPLKGHRQFIRSLSFSGDGKKLVSAGEDKTVRVWDVATGTERHCLQGHTDTVHFAVLSADGKTLISGSEDKTIRLWDIVSGKELRRLEQPGGVFSAALSRDGKTLVTGGASLSASERFDYGLLQVWDAAPEIKPRRRIRLPYGTGYIALAPDGRTVAVTQGSFIRLWDAVTGAEIRRREYESGWIHTLAVSIDSKTVAVGAAGDSIRLYDMATGRVVRRLPLDPDAPHALTLAFSPDGRKLASAGMYAEKDAVPPKGFDLWDLSTGERTRRAPAEIVYRLAFSPDSKTLATGYKELKLWDVATGKEMRWLAGKPAGVHFPRSLTFSSDGKILTALESSNAALWDVATGKKIRTFSRPGQWLHDSTHSPDGRLLATTSRTTKDRLTIHLWDMTTETERWQLRLPHGDFVAIVFAPDGRALAVGYSGQAGDRDHPYREYLVQLWETSTGQMRYQWKGHQGAIQSIAFSPDGKRLITAEQGAMVLIWDVLGLSTDKPSGPLSPEQLQSLWDDLASKDAGKAFDAIRRLAATPVQSAALLKARLQPVLAAGRQQIARLIADLGSDEFAVREKAMEQLRQLDERAEPGLREALKDKLTLEARKRIGELLEGVRISAVSPQWLRDLRAIEVLEYLDTADARQVLKTLADGAAHARLTREAKASLERLAKRPPFGSANRQR